MVVCHGAVHVVVELGELVDVVPHAPVAGVEDMGAVLVDVDAVDLLGIDIAGDMIALVDDEALLACLLCFVREHGTGETSADDEVIVLRHGCAPRI